MASGVQSRRDTSNLRSWLQALKDHYKCLQANDYLALDILLIYSIQSMFSTALSILSAFEGLYDLEAYCGFSNLALMV